MSMEEKKGDLEETASGRPAQADGTQSEGLQAGGESDEAAETSQIQEDTVETLKATIAHLEQSVASYKDQLLRKAAEFENFKKRIDNDFAVLTKFANEELIVQLLPILDDLGRSLKAGKEQRDSESLYKGVELIYNKFLKTLELQGVKEIESIGKPFDVYYHDALMEIPREDVPHHTVIDEVEKGYTLHGKVIRHAKVILSTQAALQQPVDESARNDAAQQHPDSDSDKD
jgi:molecular chaperone GrpE